jgi:hypothetical protein
VARAQVEGGQDRRRHRIVRFASDLPLSLLPSSANTDLGAAPVVPRAWATSTRRTSRARRRTSRPSIPLPRAELSRCLPRPPPVHPCRPCM